MDNQTHDAKVRIFKTTGMKVEDNDPLVMLVRDITAEVSLINEQLESAYTELYNQIQRVYMLSVMLGVLLIITFLVLIFSILLR